MGRWARRAFIKVPALRQAAIRLGYAMGDGFDGWVLPERMVGQFKEDE